MASLYKMSRLFRLFKLFKLFKLWLLYKMLPVGVLPVGVLVIVPLRRMHNKYKSQQSISGPIY